MHKARAEWTRRKTAFSIVSGSGHRVTIDEPAFSAAQTVFYARFGIAKYSGVARYRRLLGIETAPYVRGALSDLRVGALRAHAQQAVRAASAGEPVPQYRD